LDSQLSTAALSCYLACVVYRTSKASLVQVTENENEKLEYEKSNFSKRGLFYLTRFDWNNIEYTTTRNLKDE